MVTSCLRGMSNPDLPPSLSSLELEVEQLDSRRTLVDSIEALHKKDDSVKWATHEWTPYDPCRCSGVLRLYWRSILASGHV